MRRLLKRTSFLVFFSAACAFSAQILDMKEHERLEAQISAKDLNRIQVMGERIASVFGAKGVFSLEPEEVKGQAFLKIHEGAPSKIDLSLVTESGLTQDLTLKVSAVSGQTILLKPCKKRQFFDTWGSLTRLSSDCLDLIKTMASSDQEASDQKQTVHKSLPLWRDVEVTLTEIWKAEGLEGRVYVVRNKSSLPKTLHEQRFRFSPQVRAIALQHRFLKPGGVVKVYVVTAHA